MVVTEQSPTVGRIVHYRLSDHDVNDIFLMVGNASRMVAGDVLPAMVVTVNESPGRVGLQVYLDAPGLLWRPDAMGGRLDEIGPIGGRWFWPPRV